MHHRSLGWLISPPHQVHHTGAGDVVWHASHSTCQPWGRVTDDGAAGDLVARGRISRATSREAVLPGIHHYQQLSLQDD